MPPVGYELADPRLSSPVTGIGQRNSLPLILAQSSVLWTEQPATGHYPLGRCPRLGFRVSDFKPMSAVTRAFVSVASVEY